MYKVKSWIKKHNLAIFMTTLVTCILFLTLLNREIIAISLNEIDISLSQIEQIGDSEKSLHMLLKYFMITKKLLKNNEDEESFIEEASLELTLPDINIEDISKTEEIKNSMINKIAIACIDIIREIIGNQYNYSKDILSSNVSLEKAYVYERNKKYEMALSLYRKFLDDSVGMPLKMWGSVKLHIGYCQAQSGNLQEAITELERIPMELPNTETAKVATELIDILKMLLENKEEVKSIKNTVERGKKLFLLSEYKESIDLLNKYLKTTNDNKQLNEARYYLARSYEEIGDSYRASEIYKTIIKSDDDEHKDLSLKRVIMIQNLYSIDDNERKKLNQIVNINEYTKKDDNFLNQIQQIKNIKRNETANDNNSNKTFSVVKSQNAIDSFSIEKIVNQVSVGKDEIKNNISKSMEAKDNVKTSIPINDNKISVDVHEKKVPTNKPVATTNNNKPQKNNNNQKKTNTKPITIESKTNSIEKPAPTINFIEQTSKTRNYLFLDKKGQQIQHLQETNNVKNNKIINETPPKNSIKEDPMYKIKLKSGKEIIGSKKNWFEKDRMLIQTDNNEKLLIRNNQIESMNELKH